MEILSYGMVSITQGMKLHQVITLSMGLLKTGQLL